jgi:hypothetical protein
MRNKTYFSLSVEKGLRGNIGKMSLVETKDNDAYMNVMLFLVANNGSITDDRLHQIVNVHFPKEAFETLKGYDIGDYVRIHFDRIDLSKGIDTQVGEEKLSIAVKANNIELLKKSEKKETNTRNASHQEIAREPSFVKSEPVSAVVNCPKEVAKWNRKMH